MKTNNGRVTIKDVAEEAGISFSHAAQVFRNSPKVAEKTRKKVLDAARRLNYTHHEGARILRTGKSNTIGVISRTEPVVVTEIGTERVINDATAISEAIRQRGYNVSLIEVRDDPIGVQNNYDGGFERMVSTPVEGLVINRVVYSACKEQVAMIRSAGIPCVVIGSDVHDDVDGIREDDRQGMFEVTTHLVRLGHRRIMYLGYLHGSYIGFQERLKGYEDAMEAAGLAATEDLLLDLDDYPHENDPKMALDAMSAVLGTGLKPDAVVCCTDEVAFGAIRAIYAKGLKVPEDIAVVGFGGSLLSAYGAVALTTVAIPVQELAEGAVELLFQRLNEEIPSRAPLFQSLLPTLLVRESCGFGQGGET